MGSWNFVEKRENRENKDNENVGKTRKVRKNEEEWNIKEVEKKFGERVIKERISVNNALNIFLNNISWRTKIEETTPLDSSGKVLAEDIFSPIDLPPFDRSAMDGYAVIAEDTYGASQQNPAILELSGVVEIGKKPEIEVEKGKAVKISTGAMIPANANAVVMVEYTSEHDGFVEIYKPVSPGENISFKGEDLKSGDVVMKKSSIVQPHDVSLLTVVSKKIKVYSKPIVSVFSTGDELCEPMEYINENVCANICAIPDMNRYLLKSMLESLGCIVKDFGILKDNYDIIKKSIINAISDSDMVILSGATSAGVRDFIPEILSEIGNLLVHGVAIKPGMPTALGTVNGKPVILLPGFPVAAYIAFKTFAIPAIWKLQNTEVIAYPREKVIATLARRIPSSAGTRTFTRVILKIVEVDEKMGNYNFIAYPIRTSGSGILTSIVKADGILEIEENLEGIESGKKVEVELIRHFVKS